MTKPPKSPRIIPAFLIFSIAFLVACPSNPETSNGGAANPEENLNPIPDGPVRVAFVPSVEQGGIEMELEEFESKLSALIGHEVEADIVLSYSACIEQMAAGHFEVAMLPSRAYVLANERYDVQVRLKAVRNGTATYRGMIIANSGSGIESIGDLAGRTFGFTNAASTSGFLYPKTLMLRNGIDPDVDLDDYAFVGSHQAVVQAVASGRFDAGACYDDARIALLDTIPSIMEETVVIAYTDEIPSDTVSLRADCIGEFYDNLIDGMIELSHEGEDGVLFRIYEIEELVPAEDSDYDPIREMVELLEFDLAEGID